MPESSTLPEFAHSPLNELVLGVQFHPPRFYSSVLVTNVWSLYREKFGIVEEHAPIGPRFETFGGLPVNQAPTFQFGAGAPPHPRYWFVAPGGDELVQFQPDRLLHNWRQVDGIGGVYPRFHNVARNFASELNTLADYVRREGGEQININQVELSYINRIYDGGTPGGALPQPAKWLSFLTFDADVEVVGGVTQRIVSDENGQPVGRVYIELNGAYDFRTVPFLNLTLTFRGAPSGTSIDDAIEFLGIGHDIVVNTFTRITTPEAHARWHRIR